MYKIPAFFCFILFLAGSVAAQRTISGTVVNVSTQEPIPGSSVFISNTSFGTVTTKDGAFQLSDIPPGKYDLIISSVGYETTVYSFTTDKLPTRIKVELQQKVRELANVTVEPSVEEGWDRWGQVFMTNFVGQTPNAKQCRIKNEKSIRFRYYKKSNRLVAYSDEPIILENKALGYIIKYQLEDFEINYKTKVTYFAGYPLFEEIEKSRKGLQRRWQRSRDKAYYGSMMHFMRSVYNNTLADEGFEVRRMVRTPNLEKERARKLYRPASLSGPSGTKGKMNMISIGKAGITAVPQGAAVDTFRFAADSNDYYRSVLSQEDHIDTYGRHLLTADSIVIEQQGDYKAVFFEDYLYITYKHELEDPGYLLFHNEQRKPFYQRSHIWLQNRNAIAIDANGSYFPPQEVFSMSYWGWGEKIANLLPLDYKPYEEQDKRPLLKKVTP
ncbi:MAG: carboxypeptidase-like regulatory domain-containing protein [Chitinophagaceae bacterium]